MKTDDKKSQAMMGGKKVARRKIGKVEGRIMKGDER